MSSVAKAPYKSLHGRQLRQHCTQSNWLWVKNPQAWPFASVPPEATNNQYHDHRPWSLPLPRLCSSAALSTGRNIHHEQRMEPRASAKVRMLTPSLLGGYMELYITIGRIIRMIIIKISHRTHSKDFAKFFCPTSPVLQAAKTSACNLERFVRLKFEKHDRTSEVWARVLTAGHWAERTDAFASRQQVSDGFHEPTVARENVRGCPRDPLPKLYWTQCLSDTWCNTLFQCLVNVDLW